MASAEQVDYEQILTDRMLDFRFDPASFVEYAYPWGEGELASSEGPRKWQSEVLRDLTEHLQNPETRFVPFMEAVASGHGIGKSALVGQIVDWAMSSWRDCRVKITANTGDQLRTKTGPETAKWFRLSINAHWWKIGAESIRVKDVTREKTWRADFETWSMERTEAFAGLHNKGRIILLIFDESSAIPDKIWEVAEGALTDKDTVIIWLAFGNPTVNTGRFRECFGKFKHRWKTRQIDSRTVEGTNKEQIQKWIDDYGEDSDFVRVRVRGEFPRAGSNQFIPSDDVAVCRSYQAVGYGSMPKVIAIDVARFGDDQTVVIQRQGRFAKILAKWRGLDNVQVAERAIKLIQAENPQAIVVDGDGLGAGVVDQLRFRGFTNKVHEFHGGGSAHDAVQYFNRRAEVWGAMRDWIHAQAQIPNDPELDTDLTGVEYGFSNKSQIQLERKEDMKKRGMSSPDCGDALAMTFAVTVAPPKPKTAPPVQRSSAWS